ncbi:MAG TPA: DUF1638 domain-containing protein [Desulfobacterales bacterium]|nr:DUF1638 domain-containing protein [Desulfobacterales bacterium]
MSDAHKKENSSNVTKRVHVIACGVLSIDIKRLAENFNLDISMQFLKGGLHEKPMELRKQLQAAIDEVSGSGQYDRIAIGYGICGRGTVGVEARDIPLVIPKAHDCIAMFLGSNQAYKDEFSRYPGTYYISAGWYEEKAEPLSQRRRWAYFGDEKIEYDDLVKKYGEKDAKETFKFLNSWKRNYQRAVFIDTGVKDSRTYEDYAKSMAKEYNWKYEVIKGNLSLLEKLICTESTTREILVVPPEHRIEQDPKSDGVRADPIWKKTEIGDKKPKRFWVRDNDNLLKNKREIDFGLGIDAGGTFTDAVIYDLSADRVCSKNKALTTRWNLTEGIQEALAGLDNEKLKAVELVAVSTTLATNAIVEGKGQKVGLILMPPYGLFDPGDIDYEPMSIVPGRLEITGKETDPVNELQVRRIAREMVKRFQVKAFAVSGFAGTINPEHELLVQRLLHEETGLFVTCGHELSDLLNFRTRAMTAVLNARIIPRSIDLLDNIEGVLLKHGIKALIVVVKGDGTLMSAEMARERPVETILSGPAASVAGAHYLTDCEDAIVVDVGGTTSDIAAFQKGEVKICKNGADIGGFKTHVKALEIRTAGLGGDSFISWEKDHFEISPQRVGPIAWLGAKDPGTHKALRYMMLHPGSYQSSTKTMQILIKTGAVDNMSLTNQEKEIVKLLEKRPYSLDELAKYVETPHRMLLHLTHLEDNFIIQRCGLTPTDLLHVTEKFDRWDKKASLKICKLVSQITGLEVKELAEKILEQFIKKLAKEILEKELVEKTGHPGLKESKSCQVIIDHILSGADKDHVLQAKLSKPIIAIGAPVQNFLPGAAKLLNARLIIPKNEDVANAVGAITSKIMIRRKVTIKPDQEGGFLIEGLEGNRQFLKFERAVEHAENELVCLVRKIGRASGTSEKSIEINVEDKIPATANGSPVFLGRTLTAQLKGKPDMLPKQKSLGQSALA